MTRRSPRPATAGYFLLSVATLLGFRIAAAATPTAVVAPGSTLDPQPTVTAPISAPGATLFRFAEIPEIVFVRGFAGSEQLGIFHIDTANRWEPGDLDNDAGWRPNVATQLDVLQGDITGVIYDPSTAVLSYDGSGSGTQTATVTLSAPTHSTVSANFRIRVLEPTIAWGIGAANRFPGLGLDSTQVTWLDMQRKLRDGATDEEPNVLLVTGGRYEGNLFINRGKRNLYVIGDPISRPILANGAINIDDVEIGYFKNFELEDTVITGAKFPTDRPVNVFITQVYQHDSIRDLNGISAPDYEGDSRYGIVKSPNIQTHWIWNFRGTQMGSPTNLHHQFYMHGRPSGYLNVNNVRVDGARRCSIVKSTKYFNRIRNSRLSAVVDTTSPSIGYRADKLIDIASAGETVIYNNELIGAYTRLAKGTQWGLVTLRARRSWWGSDTPAYPDVSYVDRITSIAGGGYLAPEGFTSGPETFVDESFWATVHGYDLGDPQNPYTFKKHIAFNTFRWIDEGEGRRSAITDDGTAPRDAKYLGSIAEYWGTVPRNWVERSVTFLANNQYIGWRTEDMDQAGRWFDVETYTNPKLVEFVGPGPHPYPPPLRNVLPVGGERTPETPEASPVTIPGWFAL
jgi:hypothetical protein